GRCLGRQPKTGVVLRRLLDLPRLPARRACCDFADGRRDGTTFTFGLMRHNGWRKQQANRYRCSGTYGGRTRQISACEICRERAPRARARQVVPISELVFGALTQIRSSLEDRTTTRRCDRASRRRRVWTLLGNLACILRHPDIHDAKIDSLQALLRD